MKDAKMKNMLRNVARLARALHRDEGGAEMLEYILIIAVVALPLVGLLIWFRDQIAEWIDTRWGEISGDDADIIPD